MILRSNAARCRALLVAIVAATSSCLVPGPPHRTGWNRLVPDYHGLSVRYLDHPFWRVTAVPDQLSIEYGVYWYLGPRVVEYSRPVPYPVACHHAQSHSGECRQ